LEDRIVGGDYPDLLSSLADALVLGRLEFAAAKTCPELAIFGAVPLRSCDEHAVMPAPDLLERIAHNIEKVFVGMNDGTVEIERDHRLRPADRGELPLVLHVPD